MITRTLFAASLTLAAAAALAQSEPPPIEIHRATAPITIDGNVTPEEWSGATKIDTFYDIDPGENAPPPVRTVAYLTYDDRFFYVGMILYDPNPKSIRAPYSDRDNISDSIDFAGIFLSTSGDRKTAYELFATPRGVQYDAIKSDASGEDDAPDFYWDSAGRITSEGWMLEMRIPFSTLRYPSGGNQRWSVALFRNYSRDRRYQITSIPVPHGANCLVCRFAPLTGLHDLPSAEHTVVAPYMTTHRSAAPIGDVGTPLGSEKFDTQIGADAKWTPNQHLAIDATINPDFSQVESDVAAITTNERFAVFFPEKRPFFLEGKDLFATPLQAVYTRDINSPRWGARATGTIGSTAYTALVTDDRGGGAVIISGPNNSSFASEDFSSRDLIARVRHDIGTSFVSFLVTDREIAGGGHNRVFGPDGLWRIGAHDTIQAQFLLSDSRTPDRPDLTDEWDGRRLASHAAQINWNHSTLHTDASVFLTDRGDQFRADLGFIPQVGTREGFGNFGYTFRPKTGFFSRIRTFVVGDYTGQRNGDLVYRFVQPGIGAQGRWASFATLSYSFDRVRAGDRTIARGYVKYDIGASPSRVVQSVELQGRYGSDIDFANSRHGRGAEYQADASILPTDHLELVLHDDYRWLSVLGDRNLFTARVERLRATYNFTARSFLRLIAQHVRTDRAADLYLPELGVITPHDGSRTLSALYAYKLNWQTVLFLGWGDANALTASNDYVHSGRDAFVKVSYAWQR